MRMISDWKNLRKLFFLRGKLLLFNSLKPHKNKEENNAIRFPVSEKTFKKFFQKKSNCNKGVIHSSDATQIRNFQNSNMFRTKRQKSNVLSLHRRYCTGLMIATSEIHRKIFSCSLNRYQFAFDTWDRSRSPNCTKLSKTPKLLNPNAPNSISLYIRFPTTTHILIFWSCLRNLERI